MVKTPTTGVVALFLSLALLSFVVNSQSKSYEIAINIKGSTVFSNLNICIYRNGAKTKIVYSRPDSIKYHELRLDTEWIRIQGKNPSQEQKLDIYNKHYAFTKDSVSIETITPYVAFLDSFSVIDEKSLLHEDLTKNAVHVMDGTTVEIIQRNSGNIEKRMYFDSVAPSATPEVTKLIETTKDLYRKKNTKPFFDEF